MVLLLTEMLDRTADEVQALLEARGTPILRLNPSSFPREATASMRILADGSLDSHLILNGLGRPLQGVRAVWLRRPDGPDVPPQVDARATRFVAREWRRFLDDLWHTLDARWLPGPPSVTAAAREKIPQLDAALSVGLEIPPTLVTTDPAEARAFWQDHQGRIISKVLDRKYLPPGSDPGSDDAWRCFTEVVSPRALVHLSSIRYAPVVLQAYVPKAAELRVVLVGERVFAAEIRSQHNHHTRHDWRRFDPYHTPYVPHALPEPVIAACRALLARLGLSFGAFDLVWTPDGRYVFLEVNPTGEWQWVARAAGLPIAEAVADWLGDHSTLALSEPCPQLSL